MVRIVFNSFVAAMLIHLFPQKKKRKQRKPEMKYGFHIGEIVIICGGC